MVLGKLPVPGRPTIWIIVGQGPIALAVGAGGGGGCLDIFNLLYLFSSLSPSLWETARYRLKYCLKGPLNPKQPTNQQPKFSLKGSSALGYNTRTNSLKNLCEMRVEMNFPETYNIFSKQQKLPVLVNILSMERFIPDTELYTCVK